MHGAEALAFITPVNSRNQDINMEPTSQQTTQRGPSDVAYLQGRNLKLRKPTLDD